jgi:hypothetical protein
MLNVFSIDIPFAVRLPELESKPMQGLCVIVGSAPLSASKYLIYRNNSVKQTY